VAENALAQNQQQIVEIQVQIQGTKAKESRLEALIQTQMVKLDGQCKRLMDILNSPQTCARTCWTGCAKTSDSCLRRIS